MQLQIWLRSATLTEYCASKLLRASCTAPTCTSECRTVVLCDTVKPLRSVLRSSVLAMQLTGLKFDNSSLRALPIERVPEDPQKLQPQRQVKGACWSLIKPEPLKSPVLVAASSPCLALLDLQASQVCLAANMNGRTDWSGACRTQLCGTCQAGIRLMLSSHSDFQVQGPSFVEHFSGNRLLPGSETAAHCYAGHQFGHFSGQLGDGAAIYLGEVIAPHILLSNHMHFAILQRVASPTVGFLGRCAPLVLLDRFSTLSTSGGRYS